MPVSSSPYAGFQSINLADSWEQGQRIGAESVRMRDLAKKKEKDAAVKGIISKHIGPNGQLNPAAMSDLAAAGFGEEALQLGDQMQQRRKVDAEINHLGSKARLNSGKTVTRLNPETGEMETVSANEPKITAAQRTAATYAKRVGQAEADLGKLAENGFDPTSGKAALERWGWFPEAWKSGESKQQAQAERNFVNSVLRRESGAAISSSEFENAESQYFPRVGDDEQTLKQKAENRRIAQAGLQAEAGGATADIDKQLASLPQGKIAKKSSPELPGVESAQASAPAIKHGEVREKNGVKWVFRGGNPNDKANWIRKK